MLKRTWCVAALLALLAANPAAGQRQVRVEITPFGGLFLPVTDAYEASEAGLNLLELALVEELDILPGEINLNELTAKQKSAVSFGARVSAWITEVFGLEGSFTFALSDGETSLAADILGVSVEGDVCGVVTLDGEDIPTGAECDSNVLYASAKALYRVIPQPGGMLSIHLGGGPALISRGGDFWDGIDGTTDIGGVLNVGATFDVSPQVGIRLDAEDYLYSAKFEVDNAEVGDSKFQNDLFFTGGIVIKFGQ